MKTVYIASGLKNYREVIALQRQLEFSGVAPAFDWAERYANQLSSGFELTVHRKRALAREMAAGVERADGLLLLMPAKRGAHVEFGIAAGLKKPTAVFSPDPDDDISFYLLPNVLGVYRDKMEAARALLAELFNGGGSE